MTGVQTCALPISNSYFVFAGAIAGGLHGIRNKMELGEPFKGNGYETDEIPRIPWNIVDAIDLCYSKTHIDSFALITGDSDFSPLVSKLKENDKRVIGCGVRASTSDLLASNCDEFIFYDDLARVAERPKRRARKAKTPTQQEAFERLIETVESLEEIGRAHV